ncbi:hypothetical protein VAWG005_22490 [Aeromonas dhakensis]|nr:hypothetical protein VAWG003_22460 [Aeromonas dhakensis]BEE26321.1 hypothetical protein VAWG005_22490 [Aeromonas dhakensis]
MDGIEPGCAQIVKRLRGLGRKHVHMGPALVVGPRLEKGHVKRAMALPYLLEAGEIAAVAAEEQVEIIAADDPGGPQSQVAIAQAAAGEVLGRRGDELNAIDPGLLPPVQLPDLVRRHAPGAEPGPDPERGDEVRHPPLQRHYGGVIQVVIVIVGEDHPGQGRQILKSHGRGVPAFGTEP